MYLPKPVDVIFFFSQNLTAAVVWVLRVMIF